MKLINHFLFLFLIISITSKNLIDNFSIYPFLNDLKRNGLFEIILSIKKVYGQDVAIISCEELNENRRGNCKKLVTDYMGPSKPNQTPNYIKVSIPIVTTEGKNEFTKPNYRNVDSDKKKLKMPFLDLILSKKFNSEKSKSISNKIKQKIKARFYN